MVSEIAPEPGVGLASLKTSVPGSSLWSLGTRRDGFSATMACHRRLLMRPRPPTGPWMIWSGLRGRWASRSAAARSGVSCCVKAYTGAECVHGRRARRARTRSSSQKVEDRRAMHRSATRLHGSLRRRTGTCNPAVLPSGSRMVAGGAPHQGDARVQSWSRQCVGLWRSASPGRQVDHILKGAAWLNLIEVWWRLFRRQALAGQDFADGYEIDRATRVATRQLNRKASPWVWGRPPKPPRHRRRTFVYRL